MKKIFKSLSSFIVIFVTCCTAFAQYENGILKYTDSIRSKDLTSVKTNTLAELLQASINNGIISTKGTDINIKSTIFQLKKLWKPEITLDTNYVKETFRRNFEFGLGFKINNDNKVTGVGASIKYAIINNRDITRQDLPGLALKSKMLEEKIYPIYNKLALEIGSKIQNGMRNPKFIKNNNDSSSTDKVNAALSKFNHNNNDPNSLKQLGVDLGTNMLNDLGIDQSVFEIFNYAESIKAIKELATNFENDIKKRGLLTFGFGSNYINSNWDSLNFKLEYLKGLGNKNDVNKPWDIYAAAFYDLKKDSIGKTSLGRQIFTAKLGLNKVLIKNKDQKNSFIEILGAAEFNHIIKGLYSGEITSLFIADFIITVRLSPTLFLPLELKYDPKNANVFGFLKVKWDLPRTSGKG